MTPPPAVRSGDAEDSRELLLRLLPMSALLAGPSVGAVTLFRLTDKAVRLSTFADDQYAPAEFVRRGCHRTRERLRRQSGMVRMATATAPAAGLRCSEASWRSSGILLEAGIAAVGPRLAGSISASR